MDYEFLAAGIVFAVWRLFAGVLRRVRFWATRSATAEIKSSLSINAFSARSWAVCQTRPSPPSPSKSRKSFNNQPGMHLRMTAGHKMSLIT